MQCITVICLAFFSFSFFSLWGKRTAGKIQGHSDAETVKGREKDIWLVRRAEKVIESERKKSKTPEERKREWDRGPPAPLLFPGPLLTQYNVRERKRPSARSFLIICSICADPNLFSLKITQRKRIKCNATCPLFPMESMNFRTHKFWRFLFHIKQTYWSHTQMPKETLFSYYIEGSKIFLK